MDFNNDAVDDVLLIARKPGGLSKIYVHDGSCLVEDSWNYQYLWQPQSAAGGIGVIEPYALTLLPRRIETSFIALIGEEDGSGWLGSYEITDVTAGAPVISDVPTIKNLIPPHNTMAGCDLAEADYFLSSGDLDNDSDSLKDDLIFSGRQTWIYRLKDGTPPPTWDANCVNNTDLGTIPDRVSGDGVRLGYVPVPLGGANGDEMIDARRKEVEWIFDYGGNSVRTNWPVVDIAPRVDGVALSRSAEPADDAFSLVGWQEGESLTLQVARLSDQAAHVVTFTSVDVDLGSNIPSTGSVVSVFGAQRLLLVVDSALFLMDPLRVTPVLQEVPLMFPPRFLVTPNWGPGGMPVVYSFNIATGEVLCLRFDTSDSLSECNS